jgi:hypothetical protein
VQTPRFCGDASSAGTLLLLRFDWRGLRTSWLTVDIDAALLRSVDKFHAL